MILVAQRVSEHEIFQLRVNRVERNQRNRAKIDASSCASWQKASPPHLRLVCRIEWADQCPSIPLVLPLRWWL